MNNEKQAEQEKIYNICNAAVSIVTQKQLQKSMSRTKFTINCGTYVQHGVSMRQVNRAVYSSLNHPSAKWVALLRCVENLTEMKFVPVLVSIATSKMNENNLYIEIFLRNANKVTFYRHQTIYFQSRFAEFSASFLRRWCVLCEKLHFLL